MRHSYTKVSTYMKCPRMKKGMYDEGIRGKRSDKAQRGVDIHGYFELAILGKNELPKEFERYNDKIKALAAIGAQPELPIATHRDWQPAQYSDPEAWLIGIVDVWAVEGTVGHGIDWKTGNIYDEHLWQKEFYSCMLADAYPAVETFEFSNIYVDKNKIITHKFTREDITKLRERWTRRIELMERDDECVPTPSMSCRYCPISHKNGGPCQF